jgi:putative transposase
LAHHSRWKLDTIISKNHSIAIAFHDWQRMATAQKRWHHLGGSKHLADVITGVKFVDGIKQIADQKQVAA